MRTFLHACIASVLAYLGRPAHRTEPHEVDHVKTWRKSGSKTRITHSFKVKLKAKKGYIETLGLGYVYIRKPTLGLGEWFVHWNHTEQLTLAEHRRSGNVESSPQPPLKMSSLDEGLEVKVTDGISKSSKDDFSLPIQNSKGNTQGTRMHACMQTARK